MGAKYTPGFADWDPQMNRLLVVAALALLVAACGDTTATTAPPSATTTPATTTTTTPGATTSVEGDGHTHDGDEATMEWDAASAPPDINVEVTGDAASGWIVSAGELPGFEFSSPDRIEHVPGEGHTHVYIDGSLYMMAYAADVFVPELAPGEHDVKVVLSRNDHLDYALDGEEITGTTVFVVEGAVDAADVIALASFEAGAVTTEASRVKARIGDTVEIIVTSDVAEEVHLHGYDIVADLEPGSATTMRFVADIPGIFEVEMENSGALIFELEVS